MNKPTWKQIWQVERDICYLYHELSEYSGIMGDLAYGSCYAQPYWEFLHLNVRQMPEEERCFIRDGCLVMLLAMAWDVIDGSGCYLMKHLSPCQQAVAVIVAENERTERLVEAVRIALEAVEKGSQGGEPLRGAPLWHLEDLSVWVNREIVGGYFQQKAAERNELHRGSLAKSSFEEKKTFKPYACSRHNRI